jgi:hypothetical protein
MTITFYLLLTYLNLTKQRKNFDWKRLEHKMNVFFGIYSMLWLLVVGFNIFTYFTSIPLFIFFSILTLWLVAEWITDKAILVFGKNVDIMQKEFMSVNEESVKEAERLAKLDEKHHK